MTQLTQPNTNLQGPVLYRYEREVKTSDLGPLFTDVKLVLREYPIIKETPGGYWIRVIYSKKWCSNNARKSFAYDTKEKARVNLLKRSEKEVRYNEYKLEVAKQTNFLAKQLKDEETISS